MASRESDYGLLYRKAGCCGPDFKVKLVERTKLASRFAISIMSGR
jgi:hypothetical protein